MSESALVRRRSVAPAPSGLAAGVAEGGGGPWRGWVALPLLTAAVVSGEALTAVTFGLCAWGAVALVSGWRVPVARGPGLVQCRVEADRACRQGRFAAARSLFERAVCLSAGETGARGPDALDDRYRLAATSALLGDFARAGQGLCGLMDELGEGLPDQLQRLDSQRSGHAAWLARYVGAALVAQRAHGPARRLASLAEASLVRAELDEPEGKTAHRELGWLWLDLGELDRAAAHFQAAMSTNAVPAGVGRSDPPGTRRSGSPPISLWAPYRGASAVKPERTSPHEPDAAALGLAECRILQGRLAEARPPLEGLRADLCARGGGPELLGRVLRGLARLEAAQGQLRAAAELFAMAYAHDREGDLRLGATIADLAGLADLARHRGDLAAARQLLARAEAELGRHSPPSARIELAVVSAAVRVTEDPERAREEIDAALELASECWGDGHPRMADPLRWAAVIALAVGRLGLAERRLGQARLVAARLDAQHPLHRQLAQLRRALTRANRERRVPGG